jgi:hypothetical protein|tara:strand:+ start:508 stop:684 length:177 start_codon:yes stop_codon:yes gene_type:complete
MNNELVMLRVRNPLNEERSGVEANSAADMIGSGPEWNADSFVQTNPMIATQVKAMTAQ